MEINPQDLVVSFGPTQARAVIGTGNIQHVFAMNPDEVKWAYKNNTVSRDTIGGRVVQVLSSTVDVMTITGRAGSRRELQVMSNNLKKIMQYQVKTSEPVNFKVPSRNWNFLVYIQNISGLGWDVTTTSYPYEINLMIQDDLTGIAAKSINKSVFESLTLGMGYNPEFHGGSYAEATQYIEGMKNALANITTLDDSIPSELGDEDGPAGGTGKISPYCKKFYDTVLTKNQDFANLQNMGTYNCRRIANSTSYSDHAWGAAIDWGSGNVSPSEQQKTSMKTLFDYCINSSIAYHINYVIYNRKIWSRSNSTVHNYTGTNPHTNHVHISFTDSGTGTPPCDR